MEEKELRKEVRQKGKEIKEEKEIKKEESSDKGSKGRRRKTYD